MSDQTLYDDDILLWSEQQAAVIRCLRETVRGLTNELDIENVAEEIESVGRSELATVQSFVRLVDWSSSTLSSSPLKPTRPPPGIGKAKSQAFIPT